MRTNIKKSIRINLLFRYYRNHNFDEKLLMTKALSFGMTRRTAKAYVAEIKEIKERLLTPKQNATNE